jgi:hypothetical protein
MAMSARRPLPALAFLLALSLLTALVWWRVFHRAEDGQAAPAQTCNAQRGVDLPAPNTVTLTVLNGTERSGLATQASAALAAAGFVAGDPGNEPNGLPSVAEIRFGTAGLPGATLLSYYIPKASLVPTPTRTDATIEIVLGTLFPDTGGVRTPEEAAAAIAEAAAAPASGGPTC